MGNPYSLTAASGKIVLCFATMGTVSSDAAALGVYAPALLSVALPFAHIGRAIDAAARRLGSCLPRVPVARADPAPPPLARRHGKDGGGGPEERVLISEVAVRGKDGEPLERAELEAAAAAELRACRPNAALTVREVQEDVHRIVEEEDSEAEELRRAMEEKATAAERALDETKGQGYLEEF